SHLTPDQKVLLVGEEKAYPIGVPHLYSGVFDDGPLISVCNGSSSVREVEQGLRRLGITHLMINLMEADRLESYGIFDWSPNGFAVFCDFWDRCLSLDHTEIVRAKDGYQNLILLFKLVPEGTALTPVENVLAPLYRRSHAREK